MQVNKAGANAHIYQMAKSLQKQQPPVKAQQSTQQVASLDRDHDGDFDSGKGRDIDVRV